MTALLLALTVVVGGCAEKTKTREPVAFGSAQPEATQLAISAPADEVVPAGSWPSACRLLTNGEIGALLPQAADIRRTPSKVSIRSIRDKSQNSVAAEGHCSHKFWLRGATTEDITSSVSIGIVGVADPKFIAQHYDETLTADRKSASRPQLEDHAGALGPQACYSWLYATSVYHLVCRHGPLMYEVTGDGYGIFPGVPTGLEAKARHWRDKVQAPVAHIVAAKVPVG